MIPGYIILDTATAGVVKQPDEGEVYFVRENTPITIMISKKVDKIESASVLMQAR